MRARAEGWGREQGGERCDGTFRHSIILTESVEESILEFCCRRNKRPVGGSKPWRAPTNSNNGPAQVIVDFVGDDMHSIPHFLPFSRRLKQ